METDEEKKVREEKEAEEKAAAEAEAAKASSAEKDAEKKKALRTAEEAKGKSPLEEARDLDKSIKEGTENMKKLLEKNEKVMADAAISGKGFAGQGAPKQESEDEKWAKEAKVRYAGTGMDPTPDENSGPVKYS